MAQFIPGSGDCREGSADSERCAADGENEPVNELVRELAERVRASRFRLYLERLAGESGG